jgi:hypothetical protein
MHLVVRTLAQTVRRFGWFPILVFAAHETCAHVIDGYARWPSIDIPLHLLGGAAIGYFVAGALRVLADRALIRNADPFGHVTLVFTSVCTAAVFWEFAEWISDHTIGTRCQMDDLDDTMLDLAMGVTGGILFVLVPRLRRVKRRSVPQGEGGRR